MYTKAHTEVFRKLIAAGTNKLALIKNLWSLGFLALGKGKNSTLPTKFLGIDCQIFPLCEHVARCKKYKLLLKA